MANSMPLAVIISFFIIDFVIGLFLFLNPALAIDIQKRFYARINWRIEPINLAKEIRNTKIMGLFLLFMALAIGAYLLIFVFSAPASAEDDKKENVASGMEIIQVGDGQKLYVPKGTKTRKVGAQLILEDNSEYVAKKFSEMEAYIKGLESKIEELRKEIEQLKKVTDELQDKKLISADKKS